MPTLFDHLVGTGEQRRRVLMIGQLLQIAGLVMLSALDPAWSAMLAVAWVVGAQGIAGLAKDFTKTASKSAIKATSAEGASASTTLRMPAGA